MLRGTRDFEFRTKVERPRLGANRLVFIDEFVDETAVTTKMVRLNGRAPIGGRRVRLEDALAASLP